MIEVRPLTEHRNFEEAVKLQQQIWGFEEIELLPVRLFVVALKVGRPGVRRVRRRAHGRILPRDPRLESRRQELSAQPHAGSSAGISQRRSGPRR